MFESTPLIILKF